MNKIITVYFLALLLLVLPWLLGGCGAGYRPPAYQHVSTALPEVAARGDQPATQQVTPASPGQTATLYDVAVSDNLTRAASPAEVATFTLGQVIGLRTNDLGFTVIRRACVWLDTYPNPENPEATVYYCHVVGTMIGPGYSGSEVTAFLDGEEKVVGALAYGWPGNTQDFLVQPAQNMLALTALASQRRLRRAPRSLLPAGRPVPLQQRRLFGRRLSHLATSPRRQGRWAGRLAAYHVASSEPGGAATCSTVANPIGSQTLVSRLVTGDLVNGQITGTMSFIFPEQIVAFGHGLGTTGPLSLPVELGQVLGLADDGWGNLAKDAVGTGQVLGALTADTPTGVTILRGAVAPQVPFDFGGSVKGLASLYHHSLVTQFSDLPLLRFVVAQACADEILAPLAPYGWFVQGSAAVALTVEKGEMVYFLHQDHAGNITFVGAQRDSGAMALPVQIASDEDLANAIAGALATVLDLLDTTPGEWRSIKVEVSDVVPSPLPPPPPMGTPAPSPSPTEEPAPWPSPSPPLDPSPSPTWTPPPPTPSPGP